MYRAVTGIGPTDAMDRNEALLHTNKDVYVPASRIAHDSYSEELLAAIDHAMMFRTDERPQSIGEWREELDTGIVNIHTGSEAETVAINPATVPGNDLATDEKTVLLDSEDKPDRSKAYKELTDLLGKIRTKKYGYNNQ